MASLAMRSRFAVSSRPAVRAAKPAARQVSVKAFKVTLKTPSGDKTIEVAPDTYILDAAEVSLKQPLGASSEAASGWQLRSDGAFDSCSHRGLSCSLSLTNANWFTSPCRRLALTCHTLAALVHAQAAPARLRLAPSTSPIRASWTRPSRATASS